MHYGFLNKGRNAMKLLLEQLKELSKTQASLPGELGILIFETDNEEKKIYSSLKRQISQNYRYLSCNLNLSFPKQDILNFLKDIKAEYIIILHEDTYLLPHSLLEFSKTAYSSNADVIFSDEYIYDFQDENKHGQYFFKQRYLRCVYRFNDLLGLSVLWKKSSMVGVLSSIDDLNCEKSLIELRTQLINHATQFLQINKILLLSSRALISNMQYIISENVFHISATIIIIKSEFGKDLHKRLNSTISGVQFLEIPLNCSAEQWKNILAQIEGEICVFVSDTCICNIEDINKILYLFKEEQIAAVSPNITTLDDYIIYAGGTIRGLSFSEYYYLGRKREEVKNDIFFNAIRENQVLSSIVFAARKWAVEAVEIKNIAKFDAKYFSMELFFQIKKMQKLSIYCGNVCIKSHMGYEPSIHTRKSGIIQHWMENYRELFLIDDSISTSILEEHFFKDNKRYYLPRVEQLGKKHRVIVFSHELSLTGAPIVLHQAVKLLIQNGYFAVLVSLKDGPLYKEFYKLGVPVIIDESIEYNDSWRNICLDFDFAIASTICMHRVIERLGKSSIPVMWWIHDAEVGYPYLSQFLPNKLETNIKVYCGGGYAQKVLKKYRPQYYSEILLYGIEDIGKKKTDIHVNLKKKIVFGIVGYISERKGQDILAHAIKEMVPEKRNACLFIFIGKIGSKQVYDEVEAIAKEWPENVEYYNEMSHDELYDFYNQIDCMICSSRDDPMPAFITEAMMLSIPCICSENTGTAHLIEDGKNGFIYRNNDSMELSSVIEKVIDQFDCLDDVRKKSRQIYEQFFSMEKFESNLLSITDFLSKKNLELINSENRFTVSVVIPTFNAGDNFNKLIECLLAQKEVELLEIIIVDSGSNDGTVESALMYNLNVIQIKPKEFSHSYARNLGAEHAGGQYILFMVQDALPTSEGWLYNMMLPIYQDYSIVAVSGSDSPRREADLFTRAQLWGHLKFMNVINSDKIMEYPNLPTYFSIRQNANLNDVACLINKEIFKRYKYRFDFAEDLDMGLRLIKDGYKLALLGNVRVLHSHNRPPYYYLKRAFVEKRAFFKIFDNEPFVILSEQGHIEGTLWLYERVEEIKKRIYSLKDTSDKILIIKYIRKAVADECKDSVETLLVDAKSEDVNINNILQKLLEKYKKLNDTERSYVFSRKVFYKEYQSVIEMILQYLESNQFKVEEIDVFQLINAVEYAAATTVGKLLANSWKMNAREDSQLSSIYDEIERGV